MTASCTRTRIAMLAAVVLIAGCTDHPRGPIGAAKGGGYYQNDGPPTHTDIDLSQYPNAVPKNASRSKYGNPSSYTALGKRYYVLKSAAGFTQTGRASWYGRQFSGGRTSSGAPYNMFAMTAAHKRLPIPTWVRVTNLDNQRQVVVKINDRGPFHKGRIIDLSYLAARRLGIVGQGSAPVRIRTVTPATFDRADADAHERSDATPPVPLRSAARTVDSADRPGRAGAPQSMSQPPRVAKIDTRSPAPHRARGELQIGAFSSAARAARARTRARAAGVKRVTIITPAAQRRLYRVRVGPFHSFAARRRAEQILADAGFPIRAVKH